MAGNESYDPFGYYFEYCLSKTIDSFHITSRILPNMLIVFALPRTRRPKPLLLEKVGIFLFG